MRRLYVPLFVLLSLFMTAAVASAQLHAGEVRLSAAQVGAELRCFKHTTTKHVTYYNCWPLPARPSPTPPTTIPSPPTTQPTTTTQPPPAPVTTTPVTPVTTTVPPVTTTTPPVNSAQPVGVSGTWHVVFDDEFNGVVLDTTKWAPNWFGDGHDMNNVNNYAANVSVANGVVSLKLASSSSGALISTNPSGGAKPGFQFTYGYAEARIWFPGSGQTISNWPAFWTDGQSWPQDGEIDIAEGLGTMSGNYHNSAGAWNSNEPIASGSFGGSWHVYGVDWEPGSIKWYIDGSLVRTLTSATTSITSSPQYLILNNGAGHTPSIGASVQVDYVRVWQH